MALDNGADRSNRSSLGRLEPPAVGVTGDEPAHGTNGAPNLRSDVPSRQSMGWPTGREPHGHGVSVVIRAGESPAHGEGRQVTLTFARTCLHGKAWDGLPGASPTATESP